MPDCPIHMYTPTLQHLTPSQLSLIKALTAFPSCQCMAIVVSNLQGHVFVPPLHVILPLDVGIVMEMLLVV